jgi:UDP-glucose 4-epimerase
MSDNVLLIGASGFAGQSILPRLAEHYGRVYALTRREFDCLKHDNVEVRVAELDDEKVLSELLPLCRTVLYFACDSTPGLTAMKPEIEVSVNLGPLVRFLEVLQGFHGVHLLYLSSGGAIYGNAVSSACNEEHPFFPRSYYAASKISSEAFLTAFGYQTDNRVTILRPSNFYGVGQPYIEGFGIIRTVFECILQNTSLETWGAGGAKRDYLYIDDFVSACMRVLESDPLGVVQLFNVSSGYSASINEICATIEELSGKEVRKVFRPLREVDVLNVDIDSSRLRSLGWEPASSLSDGLAQMWEWLCRK